MGTDNPAWVPGEAERVAHSGPQPGTTGLYGDLPAGAGPLLELAAALIARAFTAYALGDWRMCDALVSEGLRACGEIFATLAERVVSGAFAYRVDDPAWDAFASRLAVTVLEPRQVPPLGPAVETEAQFRERLHRMVTEAGPPRGDARRPAAPPPRRTPAGAEPDLSRPGALAESMRAMGLM